MNRDMSVTEQTQHTQTYDPAMFQGHEGQKSMQLQESKRSTCEKIGKKTCDLIFAIVVILIIVALCWWMFQICSSGNTEDDEDDESPFCQILGDVGQLLGDAAHVIAVALNNFFWLLGLLVLYGIYKISGFEVFKERAEDAKDNIKTPDEGTDTYRQDRQEDEKGDDGPGEKGHDDPDHPFEE